ncbi:hypothetical protein ACV07N_13455 [Roseivirga echinicomitans]
MRVLLTVYSLNNIEYYYDYIARQTFLSYSKYSINVHSPLLALPQLLSMSYIIDIALSYSSLQAVPVLEPDVHLQL